MKELKLQPAVHWRDYGITVEWIEEMAEWMRRDTGAPGGIGGFFDFAGRLMRLDELYALDLLADFTEVLVPDAVWREVERHRPRALSAGVCRLWMSRSNFSCPMRSICLRVF